MNSALSIRSTNNYVKRILLDVAAGSPDWPLLVVVGLVWEAAAGSVLDLPYSLSGFENFDLLKFLEPGW